MIVECVVFKFIAKWILHSKLRQITNVVFCNWILLPKLQPWPCLYQGTEKVEKRYTDISYEYLEYPITFTVEMYENISLYSAEKEGYTQKVKWQGWPYNSYIYWQDSWICCIASQRRGWEEFFLYLCLLYASFSFQFYLGYLPSLLVFL